MTGFVLISCEGGHLVSRGEITVGDLTSLLIYTGYLSCPTLRVSSNHSSQIRRGLRLRLDRVLDGPDERRRCRFPSL